MMIKRDDYLNFLIQLKDKKIIKVITGIRRCGKSTLFDLYKDYLITNGVDKNQIISLNFEDPKNSIYNNWRDLYDVIEQKLQQDKINYILAFIIYCMLIFGYCNAMQVDKNVIIVILTFYHFNKFACYIFL